MANYDPKEVSVLLKIGADPANQGGADKVIAQIKRAEAEKTKEVEKQQKERERIIERGFKREAEWARIAENEEKKARERQDREEDRLHQRSRNRQLERARENRRLLDQQARERRQQLLNQEREERQQEARQTLAGKRAIKQYRDIAQGVEQLGRSMVLFGVVSEQSLEKAIRKLAVFEGAMSAMRGISNLIGPTRGAAVAGAVGRGALAIGAAAAPFAIPAAIGAGIIGMAKSSRDSTIAASNLETASILERRQHQTAEADYGIRQAAEMESVRGQGDRARIARQLERSRFNAERGPAGVTNGESSYQGAIQAGLNQDMRVAVRGSTYQSQLESIELARKESAAEAGVKRERLERFQSVTADTERQLADARNERIEAQKLATVGEGDKRGVTRHNTPLFDKYLKEEYRKYELEPFKGEAAVRQRYSVESIRSRYEDERKMSSEEIIDQRNPGRFAAVEQGFEKEKQLAQSVTDQKREQLEMSREIARTDLESLRQQHAGLKELVALRASNLRSNEFRFAMMGTGQQQRLAKYAEQFDQGSNLGGGRTGLRRLEELINAGVVQQNDPRVSERAREVLGPLGERVFGKERSFVSDAEKQGKQLGEDIAQAIIKGSRDGIDPDTLAFKLSDEVGMAMDQLMDVFNQALTQALQDVSRRQAAENAKRLAEEAAKRAGQGQN